MSNNKSAHHFSFFNARLTSIMSVSLVLFVLGIVALIGIIATEISLYVKEHIAMNIVLKDGIKESELTRLQKSLDLAPYVKEAIYISKDDALKELVADLGENPEEFLGFNPLQASIEVRLKADYANNDSLQWIEKRIAKQSAVRDISYRKDIIQLVNDNVKRIGVILLGLAAVLMLISFALISNTIRLTAYSRRFLIHTMKLVGATSWFIRRPFIVSNMVNGFVAAIVANAMLSGCIYFLSKQIDNFSTLMHTNTLIIVFVSVIVMGLIISAISAFFAVNRYIKMNHNDLYYI